MVLHRGPTRHDFCSQNFCDHHHEVTCLVRTERISDVIRSQTIHQQNHFTESGFSTWRNPTRIKWGTSRILLKLLDVPHFILPPILFCTDSCRHLAHCHLLLSTSHTTTKLSRSNSNNTRVLDCGTSWVVRMKCCSTDCIDWY